MRARLGLLVFNPGAALYAMTVPTGTPIALANANLHDTLTNSWPRFSPFVHGSSSVRLRSLRARQSTCCSKHDAPAPTALPEPQEPCKFYEASERARS